MMLFYTVFKVNGALSKELQWGSSEISIRHFKKVTFLQYKIA